MHQFKIRDLSQEKESPLRKGSLVVVSQLNKEFIVEDYSF